MTLEPSAANALTGKAVSAGAKISEDGGTYGAKRLAENAAPASSFVGRIPSPASGSVPDLRHFLFPVLARVTMEGSSTVRWLGFRPSRQSMSLWASVTPE